MALTHEEIQQLKREIFAEADEKYVAIDVCNEKQSEVNKKFANDDKRIDLLISQQKINNWLTLAIAGGIISLVIKVFLGG